MAALDYMAILNNHEDMSLDINALDGLSSAVEEVNAGGLQNASPLFSPTDDVSQIIVEPLLTPQIQKPRYFFPWKEISSRDEDLAWYVGSPTPELVVDANGQTRQAGSDAAKQNSEYIKQIRLKAEQRLFFFSVAVMGRSYFTRNLHLPVCDFQQYVPPHRKLTLMPRDHAKTSIVSHCLPPHILIQPAETNIYFPGLAGTECRLLLAGESLARAKGNLGVIAAQFEENILLRSFWPQACWENPRRQARAWNDQMIILPRETHYPDPSIRAIGVGGAITGARPNVLLKDDLISLAAANSELEMQNAIDWHKASRALLDEYEKDSGLESLEYLVGTRWAVHDLYSYIQENDPSVQVIDRKFHRIIRDSKILWPERFTEKRIEQLRTEFGSLYFLLYLNSAADPSLTDFSEENLRDFILEDRAGKQVITFDTDSRDVVLNDRAEGKDIDKVQNNKHEEKRLEYVPLNADTWDSVMGHGRAEYLRLKYA